MKHHMPQDGHTGQGAQAVTARLKLGSDEDFPQEKGMMGGESIPERGIAPAEAGDRAPHRSSGCNQPAAQTSAWGHLACAVRSEWEVTAAGAQSGERQLRPHWGQCRGWSAEPSHSPDGTRYGFPEKPASVSRSSARIPRIIQEARKSPDPECARHGSR